MPQRRSPPPTPPPIVIDNQRHETASDPKKFWSFGQKTSEYVKERTKNLAQTTENLNILNQELKDLNILNQELARKFFEEEAGCD